MSKSNYFKSLCVAVALLFAGFGARAQQFEFSGYFNGFIPVAEFNNDVNVVMPFDPFVPINRSSIATAASAGIGASARLGMWLDVGANNWLLPFGEVSFLWNSTKSSIRDVYDQNDINNKLKAIPKVPNYFNIPIQIGLKYRYDLTDIIRPFAEASIGFDMMFISKNGYPNGSSYVSEDGVEHKFGSYAYKPSGALSWTLGAGTYLGENVTVGLYYLDLGKHRINHTSRSFTDPDATNNYSGEKRHIGELALRIGFHF